MKKVIKPDLVLTKSLLDFIDQSPTSFHATHNLAKRLEKAGYKRLLESEAWTLKKGAKYYVVRNGSSIIAFEMGMEPPEKVGFKIIGAHTDSPNLRLKPNPAYLKNGYFQFGVEVYGGALLSTWTDRDLSLAGRVFLKSGKDKIKEKLLKIDKPILRIPQLAIHLNRNVNEKGLILNKQTHLPPILKLSEPRVDSEKEFNNILSSELNCDAKTIISHDLALYDTQKSSLGGPDGEFLFAPRLDNLASCHSALEALLNSPGKKAFTRGLVFFDNEEVGSQTAQGAESPFVKDVFERIVLSSSNSKESYLRAISRSLFVSADMAHAVHPNYSEMHDTQHLPLINKGPVIKFNSDQRYATDGSTCAELEALAKKEKVPVQKFVMRSDLRCGSTIGPITAMNLGIRTIDVGNPMLSMHSIREMAGALDHKYIVDLFKGFFN